MCDAQSKYKDELGDSFGDSGFGPSLPDGTQSSFTESEAGALLEETNCVSDSAVRGDDCAAVSKEIESLSFQSCNLDGETSESRQKQLLLKCFTPDADGDTYLHRYICQGKLREAATLIHLAQKGKLLDLQNKYQQTAIHLAAILDQQQVLLMLINNGARIDLTDCHGNNIFHMIAELNNIKALEAAVTLPPLPSKCYILRARAALDAQNYHGLTPFFIAVQKKHEQMCHCLAIVGATVDLPDRKNGDTALHEAVRMNEPRLVDVLISHCRMDVNKRNFSGATPLHCAAGLGFDAVVAVLLAHGAYTYVRDEEDRTPLECSLNDGVARLLSR